MAGLEPVVAFWTGWGLHFVVLLSFTVQVTLLLFSDIRRRNDSLLLKLVIWSAYMLADSTAIYALGHMSVVFRWSPEHHGQLIALWAPLLLVHLGGQDNITAYAIEDNRLWLRHLQTFVLQVAATGYVMYVSSILSHSSQLRSAAILMFLVGILKYGERISALMRADSCCSSSLSATSYDKARSVRTAAGDEANLANRAKMNERNRHLILAYSLLDVPKQMFEGPTTYVQINSKMEYDAKDMLDVVKMQVSMMYDLLYTKAAVVHTWYGLCIRILISLPFTIAALALFRSLLSHNHSYSRVDVTVTNVLLIGAVILEIISVLRAIFSNWTAVLLYGIGWDTIGNMVVLVKLVVTAAMKLVKPILKLIVCDIICRIEYKWSEPKLDAGMRQHSLFVLVGPHNYKSTVGRKIAKMMGLEDWWDSNVYSSSNNVPNLVITKVLELVSSTTFKEITKSWGQNAVQRNLKNNDVAAKIWMEPEMKLEDIILVWHIATHVYIWWYRVDDHREVRKVLEAAEVLADYMFFLLAARPYMLPYPVSRHAYAQLCTDAETHLRYCSLTSLRGAVMNQKEALMDGTPLQPDNGRGIGIGRRETGGRSGPQTQPSMNSILDRGCQLAAKLIHITAKETKTVNRVVRIMPILQRVQTKQTRGKRIIEEQAAETTFSGEAVLNMVLEVWVEMLCYTAYLCNENYHAKHLTDGGDIMTFVTLMMIYKQNGLFGRNTSGPTAEPSFSQGARDRATAAAESSSSQTADIESGRPTKRDVGGEENGSASCNWVDCLKTGPVWSAEERNLVC